MRERADVAREPPCTAVAEHVVDESEETEREHGEQHEAAIDGEPGLVAEAERAEHGPARLHDEDRDHDEDARRGGEAVAAVVLALERPATRAGRAHPRAGTPPPTRRRAGPATTVMTPRPPSHGCRAARPTAPHHAPTGPSRRTPVVRRRCDPRGDEHDEHDARHGHPGVVEREPEHREHCEPDARGAPLRHPLEHRVQPGPVTAPQDHEPDHGDQQDQAEDVGAQRGQVRRRACGSSPTRARRVRCRAPAPPAGPGASGRRRGGRSRPARRARPRARPRPRRSPRSATRMRRPSSTSITTPYAGTIDRIPPTSEPHIGATSTSTATASTLPATTWPRRPPRRWASSTAPHSAAAEYAA